MHLIVSAKHRPAAKLEPAKARAAFLHLTALLRLDTPSLPLRAATSKPSPKPFDSSAPTVCAPLSSANSCRHCPLSAADRSRPHATNTRPCFRPIPLPAPTLLRPHRPAASPVSTVDLRVLHPHSKLRRGAGSKLDDIGVNSCHGRQRRLSSFRWARHEQR